MDEFMQAALEEARSGLAEGGIPIGAVLVREGKSSAADATGACKNNDPLAHAENRMYPQCRPHRFVRGNNNVYNSHALLLMRRSFGSIRHRENCCRSSTTFKGCPDFMNDHWISIDERDLPECIQLMEGFIAGTRSYGRKISEYKLTCCSSKFNVNWLFGSSVYSLQFTIYRFNAHSFSSRCSSSSVYFT